MSKLTLSTEQEAALANADGPIEVLGAKGQRIGRLIRSPSKEEWDQAMAQCPMTDEQIDEIRRNPANYTGRSLAEIRKSLADRGINL